MPSLHELLVASRERILSRCRGLRPIALDSASRDGLAMFLDQVAATLDSEAGTPPKTLGEVAALHGKDLFARGYSSSQVVHEYGNFSHVVTGLLMAQSASMTASEFQTLNRCLDDAIAGAMSAREQAATSAEPHFAVLVHEIRNHLNTAELALRLVETGDTVSEVSITVLQRSLIGLRQLVDTALLDARLSQGDVEVKVIPLDPLLTGVRVAAQLAATAQRCEFVCGPVVSGLTVRADPRLLHSAIWNLLQNAFKFTHLGTSVTLSSVVRDDVVQIAVTDECGGLPPASPGSSPSVFEQRSPDRSGLGLGLSIARRAVEACGGKLLVTDSPGKGCTFAIEIAAWRPPHSLT